PTKSCLLFMDELDTIGQARSGVEGAAGQGRMPMFGMGAMGILNTLLSQISGLHDGYPGWKGRLFKRLWKIYQGLHELVGEEPP
ncbi:MAG: hypothetical protein GWN58_40285, partial [Anaerolineae bacterium]|nr:hypothetical protein [Anaerolineae bacterium]